MDFFDRLKNEIKSQNLTIESFLFEVFHGEVTRDVYNGWKRRGLLPRGDQLIKIAEALDTTVEYLVTGKSSDTWKPPRRYADIVKLLEELDDSELEAMRVLAEGYVARKQKRQ